MTPNDDPGAPANRGLRLPAFHIDLAEALLLASIVGSVLVVIGSRLDWATATVDLGRFGPLPAISQKFTITGSSPDQHGGRLVLVGLVIPVVAITGWLLRQVLIAAAFNIVVGVALVVMAAREVRQIHDVELLVRRLGVPIKGATLLEGLPIVFAGAGIAIAVSVAAGVLALMRRRQPAPREPGTSAARF